MTGPWGCAAPTIIGAALIGAVVLAQLALTPEQVSNAPTPTPVATATPCQGSDVYCTILTEHHWGGS